MNDNRQLYSLLVEQTHAEPDRRGWVAIPCPSCGENRKRKSAFSPHGFKCFVCGETMSLHKLAKTQRLDANKEPNRVIIPKPPQPRYWHKEPERWLQRTLDHPRRIEIWQAYRPFTLESISKYQLGVGSVPSTPCPHERLTYPYLDDERITLRGRMINCPCDPKAMKWLTAGGGRAALWGIEYLRPGGVVVICESPVDAMLLMQFDASLTAVASTAGASTWKREWTEAIAAVSPLFLLIALDNDLQGQATGETRQKLAYEWLKKRPKLPKANGPYIANQFLKAGIRTHLYPWENAPAKADIGWMLTTHNLSILSRLT